MEFHPLIILYITTKITQKTTIFTGISNVIQSILPSLRASVNRKLMADFRHSSVEESTGAPGAPAAEITKSQKTGILLGSLGVWETRDRPVRPLSTGYPHLTVDNSSGVWEFCGRLFSGASSPSAHPFLATHRNCFKALS
jgi:hypothetical protein